MNAKDKISMLASVIAGLQSSLETKDVLLSVTIAHLEAEKILHAQTQRTHDLADNRIDVLTKENEKLKRSNAAYKRNRKGGK